MAGRIEASVTSISWIPLEAITGGLKVPFEIGVAHYDQPPPDRIEPAADIEGLRTADRFRFCNHLAAWIEVDDGRIIGAGYSGGGSIGSTTLKLGGPKITFQAVAYPDLQAEPEFGENFVRFVQTAGGRTGVPAPRPVKRPPYVQVVAPTAWTTLSLTIFADGTTRHELTGASAFPRHWVYDEGGNLSEKSAAIDFKEWSGKMFGKHSPWGSEDSPALVTAAESAAERALSAVIIDGKPDFRFLEKGTTLVEQGDAGDEIFLLFDGVLAVEQDGENVAELGPGAVVGEMAIVGNGKRNATLRAVTPCRVAVVSGSAVDRSALEEIAAGRSPKAD